MSNGHVIESTWNRLSDSSKEVFGRALLKGKRNGTNRIRTRYVFSALQSLEDPDLEQLVSRFEDVPLPEPVAEDTGDLPDPLDEHPSVSPCVTASLRSLSNVGSPERNIQPVDLFVDLAKHGGGSTVRTLRSNGVDPETVDEWVQELGVSVLERK